MHFCDWAAFDLAHIRGLRDSASLKTVSQANALATANGPYPEALTAIGSHSKIKEEK